MFIILLMSFFSQKTPSQNNPGGPALKVRTMQDDINNFSDAPAEKTVPEMPVIQTQKTEPLKPVENIPQHNNSPFANTPPPLAASTSKGPFTQNPFITTPQTQDGQVQQTPTSFQKDPFMQANDFNANIHISGTSSTTSKVLSFLVTLIILASIGGGGYYFIHTRNIDVYSLLGKTPIQETPKLLFSSEKPNYLPLDSSISTPQAFQTLLAQTAQQVTSLKSTKPIEFFVTDANNKPLSFREFSKLSGIQLSSATLNALGDTFSLFVYTDGQRTNIGLSITIKDVTALKESFKQEEPSLIQSLTPLFLNNSPTVTTKTFSDGSYKNMPLRYLNLREDTSLSIDYAITTTHLIIGTSMKTHHALLDIVQ